MPMIYQSGYLTIKNYDREMDMFLLDFPNNEVKRGFLAMVASNYLQSGQPMDSWIKRAVLSLRRGQIDQFRQMLTAFLASIPTPCAARTRSVSASGTSSIPSICCCDS